MQLLIIIAKIIILHASRLRSFIFMLWDSHLNYPPTWYIIIYSGGHKSESTPIFVSHLEILSFILPKFLQIETCTLGS